MDITQQLNEALAWHRQGQFDQAEPIYRQILAQAPDAADAWHLLGLVHFQRGQHAAAIPYISRAIQLKPGEALFHNNLGEAQRAAGQWQAAEASYREALRHQPGYASAWNNLGIVLSLEGRLIEGLSFLEEAARLQPEFADAHYNRGLTLRKLGRMNEAIAAFQQAIRLRGDYAAAYNNLALCLQEQGRIDEALATYAQALHFAPRLAEAWNNQGNAWKLKGDLARAAESYRRSVELNPRSPEPLNNLGTVARAEGRLDEAIELYHRALAVKSDYVEAVANLGNAFKEQGRLDDAARQYDAAVAMKPDYAEGHISRALLLLLRGDFEHGWPEFEWRWKRISQGGPVERIPLWNGEPLEGATILLTAEQGLGDTLQFVRYARDVEARGGRVILQCQRALARLLARTPGVEATIAQDDLPLPACQVRAPLASLPGLFGTRLSTIPAQVPYVFPDADVARAWHERLTGTPGLRVGIAWRGNPQHSGDRQRSIPLERFEVLALPGVQLFSLQKDCTAAEGEVLSRWGAENLADELTDFDATAAVVTNLDLVVSCDSSVAHLAGSLARPVWVALPFAPDWRWLTQREDSPWYPTMRLFRQPRPGEWRAVFERVARALQSAPLAEK